MSNEYLPNLIFKVKELPVNPILNLNFGNTNTDKLFTVFFFSFFARFLIFFGFFCEKINCNSDKSVNRQLCDYSQVINFKNVQMGKNSMSTNITFMDFDFNDEFSDDEFSKIQQNIFQKIEIQRQKKDKDKIIQIVDLPFGLWQCRKCGTVNSLKKWPTCLKCKKVF